MSDQECDQQPEPSAHEQEKAEEAKLKAKYPGGLGGRPGGHSAFLQKRLAKGQKFFDSGDYQMAKQKQLGGASAGPGGQGKQTPSTALRTPLAGTGDAIPTPDTVPARKTSIIQASKFNTNIS